MAGKLWIFAAEEVGEESAEVFPAAPFTHEVLPGLPEALVVGVHFLVVNEEVGALEERNENFEQNLLAFSLLVGELKFGGIFAEEMQVGMVEDKLEEIVVFVGEVLINFLVVGLTLFSVFEDEDNDGHREADDGDDVACEFPKFRGWHAKIWITKRLRRRKVSMWIFVQRGKKVRSTRAPHRLHASFATSLPTSRLQSCEPRQS